MEKRYNFQVAERQMQDFWEREGIHRFNRDAAGEIYSIDTPPPTVSGSLHIGHLFSYTQAEIIARFRRMQGYNVFYPFGFDDNGLPTERLIERTQNIRARDLYGGEFVSKCKAAAEKYESDFKEFWKSLGFSVDWSVAYQTISPEITKISQQLFLELVEKGKAYAKHSPVLWCTECRTSIAQAELDTKHFESDFVYIPFMVDEFPLAVATTRPELLDGCVCLFVNPEDERYKDFIGKTAIVPLYDYKIPIMPNDQVEIDFGSGAVMCATFGDSTDAEWYAQYKLPFRQVIMPDGLINAKTSFIGGLTVQQARKEIIRLLAGRGLLLKTELITHAVGIHEPCGRAIEVIPSRQWYIDVMTDRESFLKAADKINWYPAQMKNRYIAWVTNLKWDWCISRQRYFGVHFPIWYCKECGEPAFAKPWQLPVNPIETAYEGKCKCGCTEFVPETAVFDTWATSSLTPQINERLGLKLTPMSMRTQAHEIIRTWAFYTIVRSMYHNGDIPWKDLMISGLVFAKKGEKISKSKNNNEFDPSRLVYAHSADALRYWTADAKVGSDTFFAESELSMPKRFITKLWNASKFAVSHLHDYDLSAFAGDFEALMPIDRWIIERTNQVIRTAQKFLLEYEAGLARHVIDEFFWKDFCDNYIEIVKERLYEPDIHGVKERQSGQYALYHTLFNILKLYSIYTPHITDFIYQDFFRKHEKTLSIHRTLWPKPGVIDEAIVGFGEKVKGIIFETRKSKSEQNLSMRAELKALVIRTERIYYDWLMQTECDLKACSNAVSVSIVIE